METRFAEERRLLLEEIDLLREGRESYLNAIREKAHEMSAIRRLRALMEEREGELRRVLEDLAMAA
jgi:hypothetical protein